MISIRESTFESNSSSCHSLTICSKDQFNRWQKDEILFAVSMEDFVEKDEIYEKCTRHIQLRLNDLTKEPLGDWEQEFFEDLKRLSEMNISKEDFDKTIEHLLEVLDGDLSYDKVEDEVEISETEKAVLDMVLLVYDSGLLTADAYNEYICNCGHEDFLETKTINGAEIVVFGYSGYDG